MGEGGRGEGKKLPLPVPVCLPVPVLGRYTDTQVYNIWNPPRHI